jgi:hypothetical protein
VVTARAWAKHGDRIPIAAVSIALWRSGPTGHSPWSDGLLGNQVSSAAPYGEAAQNHVFRELRRGN